MCRSWDTALTAEGGGHRAHVHHPAPRSADDALNVFSTNHSSRHAVLSDACACASAASGGGPCSLRVGEGKNGLSNGSSRPCLYVTRCQPTVCTIGLKASGELSGWYPGYRARQAGGRRCGSLMLSKTDTEAREVKTRSQKELCANMCRTGGKLVSHPLRSQEPRSHRVHSPFSACIVSLQQFIHLS